MPLIVRCLAVLALTAFLASNAPAQGLEQVTLLDFPHPPYAFGKVGEHPEKGISVAIVREIFSRMALPCTITLDEWPNALARAEKGEVDGLSLLMKTPEREKFLAFSERVLTSTDRLFFLSSHLPGYTWSHVSDLKGMRVGLVSGYAYGADFAAKAKAAGAHLSLYPDSGACMLALAKGDIDLAADEESVGHYAVNNTPDLKGKIQEAPMPIASTPYFLAISKKSKALRIMSDINRVITAMQNDGSLIAILERYHGP